LGNNANKPVFDVLSPSSLLLLLLLRRNTAKAIITPMMHNTATIEIKIIAHNANDESETI
jgi:hypothetical protein